MNSSLLFFVQGIPEMAGFTALSLALAGVPLRWGRIVAIGLFLAVVIFLIRSLPFAFGLHMIAGALLAVVIIAKGTSVSLPKSFLVVFVSGIILAFLEWIIHESLFALIRLNLQTVLENELLWTLLGLPQAVILLLLAVLIARFRKSVPDKWRI
ncbi:MAG: hypothetical protein AB1815_08100 [Bacillota bacterium]